MILSGAAEELTRLAKNLKIPVTMSLMGLGSFPCSDPLSLGMLGMHGMVAANYTVQESDLLICVGARFDDRATGRLDGFAPNARVIHLDADAAEIGKLRSDMGAFEGRKGGVLRVMAAGTGEQVAELQLDSPPVFNGMAAAGGRLLLTTEALVTEIPEKKPAPPAGPDMGGMGGGMGGMDF